MRKLSSLDTGDNGSNAQHVGSVRIGTRPSYDNVKVNLFVGSGLRFPFPALRSLELWNIIPERFIMTELGEAPLLEELTMLWPNN
ncbi:hypothetical protein QCA50_008077 [Cerrena zonata]|uniref:Uncharacterized protein n=1 Tax=Cerrena zonata TaxID=2478898 RepID=A0AAW0GEX4_9APHY